MHIDCLQYMAGVPDKAFDLAIVDPPYGLGDRITNGGTWAAKLTSADSAWDVAPGPEYFTELFRVSRNQIIWGGNHFTLPPSRCFIIWDKKYTDNWTLAMSEYAWASFDEPSKMWAGVSDKGDARIHICQKPVELYRWLLKHYAKLGDRILDTHGGSMSSGVAFAMEGFDATICEIGADHFTAGSKRVREAELIATTQPRLFAAEPIPAPEQLSIDENEAAA